MLIILKISILYKLLCRFYAIEIKIPVEFLVEIINLYGNFKILEEEN